MDDRDAEPSPEALKLVPRFQGQGYGDGHVASRRAWLSELTGVPLDAIGRSAIPAEEMRGNVENPIGTVQMPLGVAGPLWIRGQAACGVFYVPLATTEGALVRSYERGMVAISRSGGAVTRTHADENQISPTFEFADLARAEEFRNFVEANRENIRSEAESTTRHGKLVGLDVRVTGRLAQLTFRFSTGDAHGMNMISKAADRACQWIMQAGAARRYEIFSGLSSEKRPSAAAMRGTKGKNVSAEAMIPAQRVRQFFRCDPSDFVRLWRNTVVGNLGAGALGYCAQYANGITALFIACGQDVANVANAAVGTTIFDTTEDGGLYASVTLPSLTVATVGGGVDLGTSRECLAMLGCRGAGKARKLGEIAAATVLAGELSMAAAIAAGELVKAHNQYGRNRPKPDPQDAASP